MSVEPSPASTLSIAPASVKNATVTIVCSSPPAGYVTVSVTFRIETLSTCWTIVYWPWMNDAPCLASIPAPPLPPPPNPPPSCDIIPPSALF
jgi:hypothetical protein